ncbi:MAG TPA: carboxylesterase family protein [Kofleriaceae bacterium]|jgi:para-nitrobenzyl esterase
MTRVVALACTLAVIGCSSSDELSVTLDSGDIHGLKVGTMREFLGIPYAAPPVGDLRWRVPQPVAHWSKPLETTAFGNQCPQKLSYSGPSYDEDCLYINVWAPSGAHDLPVMVWLHGGAFIFGSGGDKWYDGKKLASQGVILVTLNYRLGALGFLTHPALDVEDPQYPTSGNYGIEDQIAALQWVQRNIAGFGGDPKRVTLFGESAGGFSACLHYVSPAGQDLFAAAISESGFCTTTFLAPSHANSESQALTLAEQLGCPGSDAGALACLRAVDSQTLLGATNLPPASAMMPGGPFYQPALLPNVLPNIDGVVIAQPVAQAFSAGQFAPRPLVLGNNADEGTLFHSSVYAMPVTDETDYEAALAVRFGASNVPAIVAQYPIAKFSSANAAIAAVSGDAFFVCPARATARGAAAVGAPVFRYQLNHPLENPFMMGLGVFHSSDLPFVFGNDNYPLGRVGSSGAALATAMQAYWIAFAKSYDPNSSGGTPWPMYDGTDPYQTLDTTITSATGLKSDLCNFWDQLPVN